MLNESINKTNRKANRARARNTVGTENPKKSMKQLANGILSLDAIYTGIEETNPARDYPSGDETFHIFKYNRKGDSVEESHTCLSRPVK